MSRVTMKVEFPELVQLRQEFLRLRPQLAKKHLGAAFRRCLAPGLAALRSTTPKGPTGNLRRSIASKVVRYRSGNVVGLVGYRKAGSRRTTSTGGSVQKGSDRAFHQSFVELGTRDRYTKGSIASSFRRLGPFTLKSTATQARQGRRLVAQAQRLFARGARADARDQQRGGFLSPGRGGLLRSRGATKLSAAADKFRAAATVRTTPAYPKAFFKRAARGQRVFLSSMPVGGSAGRPPVKSAYQLALPAIRALFPEEMRKSLEAAYKDMADKFPRKYPS